MAAIAAGASGIETLLPVMLPAPPFAYYYPGPRGGPAPRTRLAKVSEKRNTITDVGRWFEANKLHWPAVEVLRLGPGDPGGLPPEIPMAYAGLPLTRAIKSGPMWLLFYGGRHLVGHDPAPGSHSFVFDFVRYITPPAYIAADRQYVDEPVEWAAVRDGILYVANFHRTYARSSKGLNAFLTAIDIGHARVLWRSRPLVSNANNFVVLDDVIVTGYGFTAEPDYLYVINRSSGAIVQTVKLRSGPEYVLLKERHLFVRTYDADYVFRVATR